MTLDTPSLSACFSANAPVSPPGSITAAEEVAADEDELQTEQHPWPTEHDADDESNNSLPFGLIEPNIDREADHLLDQHQEGITEEMIDVLAERYVNDMHNTIFNPPPPEPDEDPAQLFYHRYNHIQCKICCQICVRLQSRVYCT